MPTRLLPTACLLLLLAAPAWGAEPVGKPLTRVARHGDPLPPGAVARLGAAGMRHGPAIGGSALSADGRLLATASGYSVAVWDLRAGKRLRLLPCERRPSYVTPRLAFSPDGRLLGYVHSGSFACVWDLGDGKELSQFKGKLTTGYGDCRFTPDGKEFVLAEYARVGFWDPATGTLLRAVAVEGARRLSPDAGTFVRDGHNQIVLGDTQTGREKLRLPVNAEDNGIENGIAFSADGKRLALVERHTSVQVREAARGDLLASFPLPDSARHVVDGRDYWQYRVGFSRDGRTLLLATWSGLVHRWDLASRRELTPLRKHLAAATGVRAPQDGRVLISTGADGIIRVWDAATGRETAEPEDYAGRTHAAYSPRGDRAAIGDARGRIEMWDVGGEKRLRIVCQRGPAVTKLAFAPDGKALAAAEEDGQVRFWDVDSGRARAGFRADGQDLGYVLTMTFSPDGRCLCLIDARYRMRLYEAAAGRVCWRGSAACAGFSPDGGTVTASDEAITAGARTQTNLAFLDAGTGRPRSRVLVVGDHAGGSHQVDALSYAPDGRLLAVAPFGAIACVCDPQTGRVLRRFRAILPRGADDDPFVRRLEGNNERVRALAFSADSRLLASCGNDGAVRLWEAATGEKVLERKGHEGEASFAAFTARGRSLLSAGEDGQVYLWSLRPPPSPGPKPTLEALWAGLGAARAEQAYRAVWGLSETAGAAAFLRGKIRPDQPPASERLANLIADLASDRFSVREAAARALHELGEQAQPAMRRALEARPELEVRRRLESLLDASKAGPLPAELRQVRAVQALELNGTPAAREVLRAWADGAPDARLTREAKAALARLDRLAAGKP